MKFEVYTDKVDSVARMMQQELDAVRQMKKQMYNSLEGLDGMWQGSAHDAFKIQYSNDNQIMTELCREIQEFIDCVNQSRKSYDECEQSVREQIARIQI